MYRQIVKVRGDRKLRNIQTELKALSIPAKAQNKSLWPVEVKTEPHTCSHLEFYRGRE